MKIRVKFVKGDWFAPYQVITKGDTQDINIGAGWIISTIVVIILIAIIV